MGFFIADSDTRSIEDETTTEERLGELEEEEGEGEGGAETEPVPAPPPQPESSQIVPSGMVLICGLCEIQNFSKRAFKIDFKFLGV